MKLEEAKKAVFQSLTYTLQNPETGQIEEHINPSEALAELLLEEIIWIREPMEQTPENKHHALMLVGCNDTFAYAAADCQPIAHDEIVELWRRHRCDPELGVLLWCVEKREQRPIPPLVEKLKVAGLWSDKFEALK